MWWNENHKQQQRESLEVETLTGFIQKRENKTNAMRKHSAQNSISVDAAVLCASSNRTLINFFTSRSASVLELEKYFWIVSSVLFMFMQILCAVKLQP